MRPEMNCVCMDEQCRTDAFEMAEVSTDRIQGMTSRMQLGRCLTCGRCWLRYSVEDEASGAWGKWYRGLIAADAAHDITPERAMAECTAMKWHFYGGSYYRSAGEYSSGRIPVGPPSCMAWAA